jgi:hypothetical protein
MLDLFLSFMWQFEYERAHNMLCLMLDPRYKNLHFVFSFIGCNTDIFNIDEYDQKSLIPMLLKCNEQLHHISRTPYS